MPIFIQAIAVAAHFYRLGRKWTKEGTVVDLDDFDEGEWEILRTEKNLHCREATEEEVAKRDGDVALSVSPPDHDQVVTELVGTIPAMWKPDFTKDGLPRMGALRKAVSFDGKLVTKKAVDDAMKFLTDNGFAPPSAD